MTNGKFDTMDEFEAAYKSQTKFYGASSREQYQQWILEHEQKIARLDMWDKVITIAGTVLAIAMFVLALVLYS